MEEKIKEIVSVFIRIPAEQIGPATAIDRSAMQSSILLHRMYARLLEEGVTVENYQGIKNFGDLLRRSNAVQDINGDGLNGDALNGEAVVNGEAVAAVFPVSLTAGGSVTMAGAAGGAFSEGAIGIDIEEVSAMPRANDFRKDAFYVMNFAATEIAYCILQPDPYSSFAGLFAAKEAIVKADNSYRGKGFNTILIVHSPEGRPVHPGFNLSVAHAGGLAVAAAVPALPSGFPHPGVSVAVPGTGVAKGSPLTLWLALLSLVLSVIALIIVFTR